MGTMAKAFEHFGGINPEASSLSCLLSQGGLTVNGEKPVEELVFGLTGGPAFGYFTFEYEGHDPHLYLGTRHNWHNLTAAYSAVADALGGKLEITTASGVSTAEKRLLECLEAGRPAAVHIDAGSLSYNQLPKMWSGAIPTVAVVYGIEDGTAYLIDRADVPLEVPLSELTTARLKQKKHKAALYSVIEIGDEETLIAHLPKVLQSIAEKALHPGLDAKGFQGNLGLAGMRKWAELAGAKKGAKSWRKVFGSSSAFYAGMRSLYNWIELGGTGGGGSRRHFAAFLDIAASLLGKDGLRELADIYRGLADRWTAIANTAFSPDVSIFTQARTAMLRKEELFRKQGATAADEIQSLNDELIAIKEQMKVKEPLDSSRREAVFDNISNLVSELADAEEEALKALAAASA